MKRILVISDIHGCLDKFEQLLNKVKLTKEDKLIVLGDNVDRGPDSLKVVLKMRELKQAGYTVVNIKGNHESMLMEYVSYLNSEEDLLNSPDVPLLKHNGTYETILNFLRLSNTDKDIIYNEIYSYEDYYTEDDYLFVHAGVATNIPIEEQDKDDLLWIRKGFIDSEYHGLPYKIIFGHTPTRYLNNDGSDKIYHGKDKIGIDCGCFFGGKLACLSIPTMKEYYVWFKYLKLIKLSI